MTESNISIITGLAEETEIVQVEVSNRAGKKATFGVSRMASVADQLKISKASENRQDFLKKQKFLDVHVPASAIVGNEKRFPGVVVTGDKAVFKIDNAGEVMLATLIEFGVVEPTPFTFAEAVLFGRLNAHAVTILAQKIRELNEDEPSKKAKNA